jgi:two-component system sensor histidine kinase DesK
MAGNPTTAPGISVPGAPVDTSFRWRFGWIFAAAWLVYLGQPLSEMVHDSPGWRQFLGFASLAVFVALFLAAVVQGRRARRGLSVELPVWKRLAVVAGLLVCVVGMVPAAGAAALTGVTFAAAVAAMTLPVRQGLVVVLALFASTELLVRVVPGWADKGYGLSVILAGVAAGAFRAALERNAALLRAQQELADLAVEEERSRIARDLHDILGHSLTVITVKSELAQRLLDVDTERARAELADLEELCRDALADVRATALGVRGVSLAGEIATARTALESAGIEATLPVAADAVSSRWREVFAWTIREGVTNVIRHSRACHCRVEMGSDHVSVSDDGVGMDLGRVATGQGLSGLRQRVELAGAKLSTGPGEGGRGVRLLVEVPA